MSCNCHEMNRRELFEYINQISFAVDDVKLFLDTHPEHQKAVDYFHKSLKEYAEVYGPLTVDTVSEICDCLNWINEPWPWQEGGC